MMESFDRLQGKHSDRASEGVGENFSGVSQDGIDYGVESTPFRFGFGEGFKGFVEVQFGHALAVIGWVDDWDGHRWWEIQNSHGPIYGIPPADVQARITGYRPSAGAKSFSFWAREDWFREVLGYRNTETYNAASVEGFVVRPVNVSSFLDVFPV